MDQDAALRLDGPRENSGKPNSPTSAISVPCAGEAPGLCSWVQRDSATTHLQSGRLRAGSGTEWFSQLARARTCEQLRGSSCEQYGPP